MLPHCRYNILVIPWVGCQDDSERPEGGHLGYGVPECVKQGHRDVDGGLTDHRGGEGRQEPGEALYDVGVSIEVADHHPLGNARGPARKGQLTQVLFGIDIHLRWFRIIPGEKFSEVMDSLGQGPRSQLSCIVPVIRGDNDVFDIAPLLCSPHALELMFPANHYPGPGASNLMEKPFVGPEDTRGNNGCTGLHYGPVAQDELGAVGKKDTDLITFLYSKLQQGVREGIHLSLELFIGEGPSLEEDRCLGGMIRGRIIESLEHRSPGIGLKGLPELVRAELIALEPWFIRVVHCYVFRFAHNLSRASRSCDWSIGILE